MVKAAEGVEVRGTHGEVQCVCAWLSDRTHADENMTVMWVHLKLSGYSGALMNAVM